MSGFFAVVCVNQGMRIDLEDGYQIRMWREGGVFHKSARQKSLRFHITSAGVQKQALLWFHAGGATMPRGGWLLTVGSSRKPVPVSVLGCARRLLAA